MNDKPKKNQRKQNNKRRPNNKSNNRNNNRNRRPKALSPAKVLLKHENLLEQYLIARKKYFEMYARAKGKTLQKIQNNYNKTRKDLYNFESTLNDWQKEALNSKINAYPEDNQFALEHELPLIADPVSFEGDFEDPHYLETQVAANYKDDTEESVGTIEDYNKYKESLAV